MIPFNIPPLVGKESEYIKQAIKNRKLSGDGNFTKKCHAWFKKKINCRMSLLTTSCTHALEMAAILANIKKGDEVIMSSFTFVSTANAFVLRGAKIVFVDIRPDTMNIDENLIEQAITKKTKAIVAMHYAGISCEMDKILEIAQKHKLLVIEDAAQGVMSKYKGKFLGTIGDLGCYSFHETKNYSCGEGGLILLNREEFCERAEIIREKGTNRSKFFRGQVDKYTWVDIGSSYLPSELNAAYLLAQLEKADEVNKKRLHIWNLYYKKLLPLKERRKIGLPVVPRDCIHNAHMFYIKVKNLSERTKLINHLKENNIMAVFHYIPLHSASAGKIYGRFCGIDKYTTSESEKIVRLPIYYGLSSGEVDKIADSVTDFFRRK